MNRHLSIDVSCCGTLSVHLQASPTGVVKLVALHSAMRYISAMKKTSSPLYNDIDHPRTKRKDVLNAARKAFLRDGFGGTSMDELAVAANVARRTLYNQFGSKENLFQSVVSDIWGRIDPGDLIREAAENKEPEEGLYAIGMAIANHWASPTVLAFLRLCILEGDRFPELPKSFYKYGKQPIVLAVQDYLASLVDRGILSLEDPLIATQQFIGMINEPLLWMRLLNNQDNTSLKRREDIVARAVRLFFNGYQFDTKT